MSGHSVTGRQTVCTYRSVSVVFPPLALWRAVVDIRSTGTGPGEVSLDSWNDRLGMHDAMIQDIVNLGRADVLGIVLGGGNGCVGVRVGNVAAGAREFWFRVGCKFGLDVAS